MKKVVLLIGLLPVWSAASADEKRGADEKRTAADERSAEADRTQSREDHPIAIEAEKVARDLLEGLDKTEQWLMLNAVYDIYRWAWFSIRRDANRSQPRYNFVRTLEVLDNKKLLQKIVPLHNEVMSMKKKSYDVENNMQRLPFFQELFRNVYDLTDYHAQIFKPQLGGSFDGSDLDEGATEIIKRRFNVPNIPSRLLDLFPPIPVAPAAPSPFQTQAQQPAQPVQQLPQPERKREQESQASRPAGSQQDVKRSGEQPAPTPQRPSVQPAAQWNMQYNLVANEIRSGKPQEAAKIISAKKLDVNVKGPDGKSLKEIAKAAEKKKGVDWSALDALMK